MYEERKNQSRKTNNKVYMEDLQGKKKINKTHKIIKKRNRGNLRRRGFLANTEPT